MKFFKSEKNDFFKQMCREFNCKAFSGLILIRNSIALELNTARYRERHFQKVESHYY